MSPGRAGRISRSSRSQTSRPSASSLSISSAITSASTRRRSGSRGRPPSGASLPICVSVR